MYCTLEMLINRFGESEIIDLTDKDGETGAVVDAVAQMAIDDATSTINGYLAGRFVLPLVTVPDVIPRLAAEITRYFLYDEQPSELVTKRYEGAVKTLEQISKGIISLGLDSNTESPVVDTGAEIQSAGSHWARDKSTGFI